MIKKIIIFGSCNTAGAELWADKTIENYCDMDILMAAHKSNVLKYAEHVQNGKSHSFIKEQIEYEIKNSWVKKLQENFVDAEILNFSIAQSNLKNFIKASTYFTKNKIDKKTTRIILEMTEPTGLTFCQNDILKSYGKPCLEIWTGKEESTFMNSYLDKYETDRYRAYIDLLFMYNLVGNLRHQGYTVDYFIWNRDPWTKIIEFTQPISLYQPYNEETDILNSLFFDFFKDSLISYEQEKELQKFKTYPQGHFTPEAHNLLGEFIVEKIKDHK